MDLFRPSQYLVPATVDDAIGILMKRKDKAFIVGGGTEIYELAQRGLLSNIDVLVDLRRLSLNTIGIEKETVRLGASVTLTEMERNNALYRQPALAAMRDAIRKIQPLQVKNMATVGGAICSCMPFFDLPVALAALDSRVLIRGKKRKRIVPLIEFQRDFLQPDLKRGEFLQEVMIPRKGGQASAFSKLSETGDDWAIVNCACSITFDSRKVKSARIVFGAISNKPFLALRSADAMVGQGSAETAAERTLKVLDDELPDPDSDSRASSAYRKRIAKVLLQETVETAFRRIKE